MKRLCSLILVLALTPASQAHFIWILPDTSAKKGGKVRLVFSDTIRPDENVDVKKIAATEVFIKGDDARARTVKKAEGTHAYEVTLEGEGPYAVAAVCHYGVVQRGKSEPFLLHYYAKHSPSLTPDVREGKETGFGWGDKFPLEIRHVVGPQGGAFQAVWQGKPLPNVEVVAVFEGLDKSATLKTDKEGYFFGTGATLPEEVKDFKGGLMGFRVSKTEEKSGEHDGKKYKEVRHHATLTVGWPKKEKAKEAEKQDAKEAKLQLARKADKEPKREDPAASKLLAEARAARANWHDFPGFTADLTYNDEGKVLKGKLSVSAKGEVTLELPGADEGASRWVRRTMASIVGHRTDNSAALKTPCAFADDVADHPLGRAVKVLDDEFHSSYRIRDRQIIVVNRRTNDVRFTITVLENRLNEEKQYLSGTFVVNTWDLKTDALKSSETHTQTWKRVGKFDLPESLLVVTATAGKQEAQRITLSNLQLKK